MMRQTHPREPMGRKPLWEEHAKYMQYELPNLWNFVRLWQRQHETDKSEAHIRRHMAVYVNDADVRSKSHLEEIMDGKESHSRGVGGKRGGGNKSSKGGKMSGGQAAFKRFWEASQRARAGKTATGAKGTTAVPRKKTETVVIHDMSNGKEPEAIRCVNAFDNRNALDQVEGTKFEYVSEYRFHPGLKGDGQEFVQKVLHEQWRQAGVPRAGTGGAAGAASASAAASAEAHDDGGAGAAQQAAAAVGPVSPQDPGPDPGPAALQAAPVPAPPPEPFVCQCKVLSKASGVPYPAYNRSLRLVERDKSTPNKVYECDGCAQAATLKGITAKLDVFRTGDARGFGVRARQKLKKGTFVCCYLGELLNEAATSSRAIWYDHDLGTNYVMDLDESVRVVDKHAGPQPPVEETDSTTYDYDLAVDAMSCGNVARWLNHSCEPNTEKIFVFDGGGEKRAAPVPRLAFFTSKDVEKGTELTWNYEYTQGCVAHCAWECFCGAAGCKGRYL